MTCSGTTQSMDVPHIAGIDFGQTTDTYTIFFWFKTASVTNTAILDKTSAAPTKWPIYAQLATSGTKMQMQTWDGTTNPLATSTTTINDNVWHHFALLRDRSGVGKIYVYVDRVSEANSNDTLPAISNSNSIKVMGASRQSLGDTNGLMDELTIWNILKIPTTLNWQADHTGEANLQGYYQLNNNANDASPNVNNGTTTCTFSTDVYFANYNAGVLGGTLLMMGV